MSRVIAHRGYSSKAPENTMAALKMAVDFGVDGLEFDVHVTKDGEVVICHDESVDRTTNGKGLIVDYTYEELQKLDAGSWFSDEYKGEKIPRLTELFDLVRGSNLLLNIELKTGVSSYRRIEKAVLKLIEDFSLTEQVIISSFNHYSLKEIKNISPKTATGILYMAGLFEPWNYAKAIDAQALHPYFRTLVPELVLEAKARGLQVNPFTVNEPDHIAAMLAMNVDGIITNYPERVGRG